MLNWAILKHPVNWVTVFLMTVIGIAVLNLLLTPWHIPQKNSVDLNANSIPGPYFGSSILSAVQ